MKRPFAMLLAACFALAGIAPVSAAEDDTSVSTRAVSRYTVKVIAGKNGKVSGKSTTKVKSGGKAEFTVTPSRGYLIDSLTVNGAPAKKLPSQAGRPYKLTVSKIKENKTVTVAFTKKRVVTGLSVGSQVTVVDAK